METQARSRKDRGRTRIAILGEFNPGFPPHPATDAAIVHSCHRLGTDVRPTWLSTRDITPKSLKPYAGIWVAPGSPYESLENTLQAIRYAREAGVPCFGTCGGCQHIIIEYARNVLGYRDAQHAEYDPYASRRLREGRQLERNGRVGHPGTRDPTTFKACPKEVATRFRLRQERRAALWKD